MKSEMENLNLVVFRNDSDSDSDFELESFYYDMIGVENMYL